MRIGVMVGEVLGAVTLDELIGQVRTAADLGFGTAWSAQLFGWDALTTLAIAGREVPGIRLGTGVVPTYPRHPLALASQALTVQAATGNRLILGVGLSHQLVIEGLFGYSYARPARHMREYLTALAPLLRGESVSFQGETLKAVGTVTVPEATPPPLLVAALGPAMLRLTGEIADGTVTWMTGPSTIADHIVPTITAAAAAAGRPDPQIVAGLGVCVTDDPDGAHRRAAAQFSLYGQLPSYRAMLDREGADGPEDVALIGDEASITAQVGRLADAGTTELVGVPFGTAEERTRTLQLLGDLATSGVSPSRLA
jgi:F420-dependent oxidoreductase-like protein